jgi:hypothetical protein
MYIIRLSVLSYNLNKKGAFAPRVKGANAPFFRVLTKVNDLLEFSKLLNATFE